MRKIGVLAFPVIGAAVAAGFAGCADDSDTRVAAGTDGGAPRSPAATDGSDADGGRGEEAAPAGLPLLGDMTRAPGLRSDTPLSGVVALTLDPATGAADLGAYIRSLVDRVATGKTLDVEFPLRATYGDRYRAVRGTRPSLVVKWLDPLTNAADPPRFGANADYVAFFGNGWNASAGDPPQWHGSGEVGWLWVNHEYVSGDMPTPGSDAGAGTAPTNQNLLLADFLQQTGKLSVSDPRKGGAWLQPQVDAFIEQSKRQHGGSWLKIVRDPITGAWSMDRSAANKRYDATSATQLRIRGTAVTGPDQAENGAPLPLGVSSGIAADCSGAVTPWGTILSAEENVQSQYGDIETCWGSDNAFRPGRGCDPGGPVTFATDPAANTSGAFNRHSNPSFRHRPELFNYLAEIDPGVDPGEYEGKTTPGTGHAKIGAMGRARWENATFAVDAGWKLVAGKPVVVYAGDDRVSGRIYKLVSTQPYTTGMTRAQVRALLDTAKLYVAHLAGLDNRDGYKMTATGQPPSEAARGDGRWIHLSVSNTVDDAPNGAAAGQPGVKVGAALNASDFNRMGAFTTDDDVRRGLFTASNKLGIMELNRPEKLEWNPKSPLGKPQLFVAFTKNTAKTALDAQGLVYDPSPDAGARAVARNDRVGAIFVMEEADPTSPGASTTFTFWQVWGGSTGLKAYDAANPDNLVIDREGGVWFGTDGNQETNNHADAYYYLDLDPKHREGQPGVTTPTFARAFRFAAVPADAEATGPAFSPDMKTFFSAVQHPGEGQLDFSTWPQP